MSKMSYRTKTFVFTVITALFSLVWGTYKIFMTMDSSGKLHLTYTFSGIFTFIVLLAKIFFIINYIKPFNTKTSYNICQGLYLIVIATDVLEIINLIYQFQTLNQNTSQNILFASVLTIVSFVEFVLALIGLTKVVKQHDKLLISMKAIALCASINSLFMMYLGITKFFNIPPSYQENMIYINISVGLICVLSSFVISTTLMIIRMLSYGKSRKQVKSSNKNRK